MSINTYTQFEPHSDVPVHPRFRHELDSRHFAAIESEMYASQLLHPFFFDGSIRSLETTVATLTAEGEITPHGVSPSNQVRAGAALGVPQIILRLPTADGTFQLIAQTLVDISSALDGWNIINIRARQGIVVVHLALGLDDGFDLLHDGFGMHAAPEVTSGALDRRLGILGRSHYSALALDVPQPAEQPGMQPFIVYGQDGGVMLRYATDTYPQGPGEGMISLDAATQLLRATGYDGPMRPISRIQVVAADSRSLLKGMLNVQHGDWPFKADMIVNDDMLKDEIRFENASAIRLDIHNTGRLSPNGRHADRLQALRPLKRQFGDDQMRDTATQSVILADQANIRRASLSDIRDIVTRRQPARPLREAQAPPTEDRTWVRLLAEHSEGNPFVDRVTALICSAGVNGHLGRMAKSDLTGLPTTGWTDWMRSPRYHQTSSPPPGYAKVLLNDDGENVGLAFADSDSQEKYAVLGDGDGDDHTENILFTDPHDPETGQADRTYWVLSRRPPTGPGEWVTSRLSDADSQWLMSHGQIAMSKQGALPDMEMTMTPMPLKPGPQPLDMTYTRDFIQRLQQVVTIAKAAEHLSTISNCTALFLSADLFAPELVGADLSGCVDASTKGTGDCGTVADAQLTVLAYALKEGIPLPRGLVYRLRKRLLPVFDQVFPGLIPQQSDPLGDRDIIAAKRARSIMDMVQNSDTQEDDDREILNRAYAVTAWTTALFQYLAVGSPDALLMSIPAPIRKTVADHEVAARHAWAQTMEDVDPADEDHLDQARSDAKTTRLELAQAAYEHVKQIPGFQPGDFIAAWKQSAYSNPAMYHSLWANTVRMDEVYPVLDSAEIIAYAEMSVDRVPIFPVPAQRSSNELTIGGTYRVKSTARRVILTNEADVEVALLHDSAARLDLQTITFLGFIPQSPHGDNQIVITKRPSLNQSQPQVALFQVDPVDHVEACRSWTDNDGFPRRKPVDGRNLERIAPKEIPIDDDSFLD